MSTTALSNSASEDQSSQASEIDTSPPRKLHLGINGLARIGTEDVELFHSDSASDAEQPLSETSTSRRPVLSVLDELDRVSSLQLGGPLTDEIERKLVETPAPALQHLELYATLPGGKERYRQPMPVLFAGQHPQLTSLTLGNYSRLGENNFSNLKRLWLSRQLWVPEGMLSLAKILNSSPELEELGFKNPMFHTDPTRMGADLPPVHLRHLKKLVFENVSMGYAVTMMPWIRIDDGHPLALTTRACGAGVHGVWHEPLDRLDEFFEHNPYGLLNHMTRLTISISYAMKKPGSDSCSLIFAGPEHSASLLRYNSSFGLSTLLRDTMSTKPIEELWIKTAGLRSAFPKQGHPVKDVLTVAQNIRRLYVQTGAARTETQGLWQSLAESCPALEELHVKLSRCRATANLDRIFAMDSLKEALQTRAARGLSPITRVHLYPPRSAHAEEWRAQVQQKTLPNVTEFTVHPAPTGSDSEASFPKMDLPSVDGPRDA